MPNAQYAEFLNAVGPAVVSLRGLYNGRMSSDSTGGIGPLRDGKYQIKPGRGNNPVNYVSFLDAMAFVNWLHNGQPTDGSGIEDGVYAIRDGVSEIRNPSARYFIPSENEWYKAAYHKNNGATGGAENYWEYPTSTDAEPYSDEPPGIDSPDPTNTGNFPKSDGVANGYNDGFANSNGISPMTDVGAYAMSVSPYGNFDQGATSRSGTIPLSLRLAAAGEAGLGSFKPISSPRRADSAAHRMQRITSLVFASRASSLSQVQD